MIILNRKQGRMGKIFINIAYLLSRQTFFFNVEFEFRKYEPRKYVLVVIKLRMY
jgi:hypothetical protein